jgi:2-amino-4-hydroxy-6-hydroxymethyldihydropteridine diphosphokinase
MAEAYLALGGNVGDSRRILDRAVQMLSEADDIKVVARSSDYLTPPWGMKYQAPFVNLCLAIETALAPHKLLERTQTVELQLGRDRLIEKRWGPRTCDIDILAYDDVKMNDHNLTLPHPLMFERGFVLMPLAEIAGDKVIGGERVKNWLGKVDTTGIRKLPRT